MFETKMNNTYIQAAEHLSVSVATVNRWRRNRDLSAARQFSPVCVLAPPRPFGVGGVSRHLLHHRLG